MKFDYKDIVWIAIVVLIVIYLSKCHRDNAGNLEDGLKQLQDKAYKDSIAYIGQIGLYDSAAKIAQQQAAQYSTKNQVIEQQLDKQTATVLRLSNQLRAAKIPLVDTTTIAVDQAYVDYCDSLAYVSSELAINFNNYKTNTTSLIRAKDAEITAQNGIITTERQAKADCKNNYNALMHLYTEQSKASKPRNQLFVGAELINTSTNVISNVGVALSLKTKSNKLWQLSGGLQTNGQYYARINGNILISLKR